MKIYCINLKRSTERRAKMETELESLGLEYEFLDAVDGRLLSSEEMNRAYSHWRTLFRYGLDLTAGEIGVAMSHCKFFNKVIERGKVGFVVEDDVSFLHGAADAFKIAEEFLENVSGPALVQLPGLERDLMPTSRSQAEFVKVSTAIGAYAYGVNPEGAKVLLRFFTPIRQPIDKYDYIIKHTDLNFFVYSKLALSVDMKGESMVGNDRKKFSGVKLAFYRLWRCVGVLLDRILIICGR